MSQNTTLRIPNISEMVSKYPLINEQASPHISLPANYSPFTEPGRRAGYMGPELGRIYPHPFPPSHTHVMHETVQREIEKQRVREEIIMSEIVRRQVLEAEVRRELLMESELASRIGRNNRIPIGLLSSSVMGFEPPTRLPVLGTGGERKSLEERIILSLAEKEMLGRRGHESGGFETLPFQRRSDDLRISDVRPAVSEGAKEKRKIICLVKPDEDIAGSKRKASTPSAGLVSSESPSTDGGIISSTKAKAEWFCSVCHVSATSEQALNEHLKGRKHKSKEATLRAQRAGKNYSMGLFPKNATKSIEVLVTADSSNASESPHPPLLTEDQRVVVPEAQKKDGPEKDQSVVPDAQEKEESTKKRFRFWCKMCRVGSDSKKVLNAHKRGKKHARRLEAGRQASDNRENIVVLVNREGVIVNGDVKNVTSVDVDEALEEAGPKDHVLVDENKADDDGLAVECAEPADEVLADPDVAGEPKDDKLVVA